jgi:hypothetical protein
MSDAEWLGEVPIYRYDPKASAAEGEEPWAEGTQILLVNPDGEVVGTGTVGPRVETEAFDGWSITVSEEGA